MNSLIQPTPELIASVREELRVANSPWCDRKGAASYCSCSPTTIDGAANKGEIKRYFRQGTPMFKKTDLDNWIENGPVPQFRLERMGAPCYKLSFASLSHSQSSPQPDVSVPQ